MTLRRAICLAAMILLIVVFAQAFSIDLALVWAGDTVLYFEVVSAVMFFIARGHARQMIQMVGQAIRKFAR
jgi:hypothetical protein